MHALQPHINFIGHFPGTPGLVGCHLHKLTTGFTVQCPAWRQPAETHCVTFSVSTV